ncbi:MAG: WecB/TagA/CpsF family glycosyltransferase [Chlorobiaceae bacterium]|nr:WecB/TagA/CpsF family glycosyltransferase [Chlorobiaceae bacterium]
MRASPGNLHLNNGLHKAMKPSIDSARELEKRLKKRSGSARSRRRRIAFIVSSTLAETTVRIVELAVALVVTLFLFTPVVLWQLITAVPAGKAVFSKRVVYGISAKPFTILRFAGLSGRWADLPLFLELFTGRLALAGTALKESEAASPNAEQAYINMVKPGIISLWDIRRSSKIAHEGIQAIEWEYIFRKHPFYDLMLVLRALPAMLYTETIAEPSPVFHLLGLDIDNITMEEAIAMMQADIALKKQSSIFFVNPDCLNKTISDKEYRSVLKNSDHIFPDGVGLIVAGKLMQSPLRENINGTDMLPFLCRMAAAQGHSIFLLGGKPGVAQQAAEAIHRDFGVMIAGTADGYFNRETENEQVISSINNSGAAILLVAFGAPLQEKWISRHRSELQPGILMGVGGLFDFYSGNISRAPRWIREIGFEWVYRILQEPARMWRRYVIGNPLFLYRVMKWKLFTGINNR